MNRAPIDLFVEAFATAAGQILSEKASSPWSVTINDKPKPLADGAQMVSMLLLAEASKAEAAIQLSQESALTLASTLGGAASAPPQFQPEHAQAVRAVFAEACGKAAALLEGTQVKLQVVTSISWTPARTVSLAVSDGRSGSIQLQLLFTDNWPELAAAGKAASPMAQAGKGIDVSVLESVEIDVTLQFGERRLPLREIGELRSGSVVVLDKYLQDPAELLLGDRVVARGEVVIVDGNYGLRVTEVV